VDEGSAALKDQRAGMVQLLPSFLAAHRQLVQQHCFQQQQLLDELGAALDHRPGHTMVGLMALD
jgi:hypothetical protein